MEALVTLLCVCFSFLPILLGVGITLFLERHIGVWAYLVGLLVPIITLALIFITYEVWTRTQVCDAATNTFCGAPLVLALTVFVGAFCLTGLANALAQGAVYMYLRARHRAEQYPPQTGDYELTDYSGFAQE